MTVGHIQKVDFIQHPVPDATDATYKFGLMIIVEPEDAKSLPNDLIMMFFGWGDPELVTFMEQAGGNYNLLLGMAVTFDRTEKGITNVKPDRSLPTKYPEMDYQRRLREFRESLKRVPGRRLEVCRRPTQSVP